MKRQSISRKWSMVLLLLFWSLSVCYSTPVKRLSQAKLLKTIPIAPCSSLMGIWAVSPDNRYICYCNKIISISNLKMVSKLPVGEDNIHYITWSNTTHSILMCGNQNVYILRSIDSDMKKWTVVKFKTNWEGGSFTLNDRSLIGVADVGKESEEGQSSHVDFQVIRLVDPTVPKIVSTIPVSKDQMGENVNISPYQNNSVLICPLACNRGYIVNSKGQVNHSESVPAFPSGGPYDLITGPIQKRWFIVAVQYTKPEDPYLIMVWQHTDLIAVNQNGKQRIRLAWNRHERISNFQATGTDCLWVEMDSDSGEYLYEYKIEIL